MKSEEQQRDAQGHNVKAQEHNVKAFTQLLMEHDNDSSQKEQARKGERSKDARSKRSDLDERAKSLDSLRHTRCDRGVVELPAGSMLEPRPTGRRNRTRRIWIASRIYWTRCRG